MSTARIEKQGRRSEAARAKGRITLSRPDLVQAGAEILDSKGSDGLSMRAVAQHLGTGSATLYWHVHNKEDLLKLILDETFRAVVPPQEGEWDARLAATATQARAALLPRPSLVPVLWESGWDLGPNVLRVADALLALVAESGLPDQDVTDAYFAVITYVLGFVVAESSAGGTNAFGSDTTVPEDGAMWDHLREQYPSLARYGPGTDPSAMHRRFTLGLDSLIRGIKTAGP